MELKRLFPIVLAACVPQTKQLILPDGMMKGGQAVTLPAAGGSAGDNSHAVDPWAPLTLTQPKPVPAAVPAAQKGAAPLRAPGASSTPAEQRYVLRLVEHGRVWEVELPEETGGYEVRVPLGPPVEAPTLADQELLGKDPKAVLPKSYLSALARIAEMYTSHKYELALIEAADLGQQYPKEARVEAMKGSLYQKLGKTDLAREAWKKALELDPTDVTVAEALRGLKGD